MIRCVCGIHFDPTNLTRCLSCAPPAPAPAEVPTVCGYCGFRVPGEHWGYCNMKPASEMDAVSAPGCRHGFGVPAELCGFCADETDPAPGCGKQSHSADDAYSKCGERGYLCESCQHKAARPMQTLDACAKCGFVAIACRCYPDKPTQPSPPQLPTGESVSGCGQSMGMVGEFLCGEDGWQCVTCASQPTQPGPVSEAIAAGDAVVAVCPCLLIEPCSAQCSCRFPIHSAGCRRCATYGSLKQQEASARHIAEVVDALTPEVSSAIAAWRALDATLTTAAQARLTISANDSEQKAEESAGDERGWHASRAHGFRIARELLAALAKTGGTK